MVTVSAIGECSFDGKPGIKATYWNNRESKGDVAATEQLVHPLKLTTFGQHEFSTGVHLENFSAKYETIYKPSQSGEIAFKMEACGAFQLIVNGDTLARVFMWRPLPKRVVYKVEKGKEYKIEACFRQIQNWTASLSMDFGKEVPVKYDALIEKLKGIDLVIFAGGISAQLEGEEMPIQLPGFKGATALTLNFRKCSAIASKRSNKPGRRLSSSIARAQP